MSLVSFNILGLRYHECFARPGYISSALLSSSTFIIALVINTYAVNFASREASNPVTDIILSNTDAWDVTGIYVYGLVALTLCILALCIARPKQLPFIAYSLALFVVTRAAFVSLTHFGPFDPSLGSDFSAGMQKVFFGKDYFFSGHTGVPFLMALIYWRHTLLRWSFLALSVFFATVVLLGHLHYSIDVFAAFFITYTIYHIALYLFPDARALFLEDDPSLRDVV
jgi:hypothetical protein